MPADGASTSNATPPRSPAGRRPLRHLALLRYLLIWPAWRAIRRRSRRSLAWRLAISHLMTVLATLAALIGVLWAIGLIATVIDDAGSREAAADARAVSQILGGGDAGDALDPRVGQEVGNAILLSLAQREIKLDQDAPEVTITFNSTKRLEHVRSISVVDDTGTVVASSDRDLIGRPVADISRGAADVTARALAGSISETANTIIRRENGSATVGAYPLAPRDGRRSAVLVDKSDTSNPRGLLAIVWAVVVGLITLGVTLLIFLIPAAIVAAMIGIPRARAIVRPVRGLSRAATALSRGDLDQRVVVQGEDEVAVLAGSFNAMAGDLQQTISQEAAERARVEERTRELAALLDISRTVASTLELDQLVALTLDQLTALIESTGSTLMTINGDALTMLGTRSAVDDEKAELGVRFPFDQGSLTWGQIMRLEPVIIADVRTDEPFAIAFRETVGGLLDRPRFSTIRAWMAVPLAVKDRVIGMLTMSHTRPDYFDQRHARLARAVADQAALAIENARLYQQAASLAALEERTRLARDLHDSITQSIFSLGMLTRAAQMQQQRGASALPETLERISTVAGDALAEMRALIFELRPAALEEDSLRAALEKLVASARVRTDAVISCAVTTDLRLAPDTEVAIFRIVQEALGNAAKHAAASEVTVRVDQHNGNLRVTITDNGAGFDPAARIAESAAGHGGGVGISSMRERAAAAGITLRIHSAPGAGATVTVEAPASAAVAGWA